MRLHHLHLHHTFRWGFIAAFGVVFTVGGLACSPHETASKSDEQPNSETTTSATGGVLESGSEPVTLSSETSVVTDTDLELPGEETATSDESIWTPSSGDFILQDRETGTLWNLRGEAYRGELAGERLEQLPAFNSFWFAWSAFYDGSELWNREVDNTTADFRVEGPRADKECLVPCDEIRMGCPTGKDCIPALNHDGQGQMVEPDSDEADYLTDNSVVLGVEMDGQARAYPHNILWWHEIYNDKIGDTNFSVTFCPLTGSGIVFEGRLDTKPVDFGVSGRLYNANLVMYDRGADEDTFWAQMTGEGIKGPRLGEQLERLPVVETTWAHWLEMHPDTKVVSEETGHSRDYSRYPYADYRTDDSDTHQPINPDFQKTYRAKDRVLGLVGESASRGYAFPEMNEFGRRVVVNDTFEGEPIVVVFEGFEFTERMGTAIPFSAEVDGRELTFVGRLAP